MVAADEPQSDHISLDGTSAALMSDPVLVQREEGRIRADHRQILPAVAVVVKDRESAAVAGVIET